MYIDPQFYEVSINVKYLKYGYILHVTVCMLSVSL